MINKYYGFHVWSVKILPSIPYSINCTLYNGQCNFFHFIFGFLAQQCIKNNTSLLLSLISWKATIYLVPNVVVPKRFRVLEFIKYSGTQGSMTHIKSYCNKMAEVVHDEKLLMHFFQDSLSGVTLSWYMRLDNTKIRRWKDLVHAFIKQYKYNMDIASDRTSLSNLEKRDKESIREYAQR